MNHNKSTGLALGCSHTAGVALTPADCYVSVLSRLLDCAILNRAVPGGNATHVQNNLVQALKSTQPIGFVIAQWPNPFRRTVWHGARSSNENINNASAAFQQLLHAGPENFMQPWIDTIIVCNLLCSTAKIPCINIMIEDVAPEYHAQLANEHIQLHVDRKLPGETWLMDSAASDKLHHSAQCHKQWAERIFGLLNEHTPR